MKSYLYNITFNEYIQKIEHVDEQINPFNFQENFLLLRDSRWEDSDRR